MTIEYQVVCADPAWRCKDQLPGPGRGASKKYKTMPTKDICDLARTFVKWDGNESRNVMSLKMSNRRVYVADTALLALWRLGSMQRDALDVCQAWGFKDKAELVWVKYRPCVDCKGEGGGVHYIPACEHVPPVLTAWTCELCEGTGCGTPWFGMGRYTRAAHETVLIAARGRMASEITAHNIRSTLHAPMPWDWKKNRPIHSAKPERFYTHVIEKLAPGPYLELFGRRRRVGWTVLGNQTSRFA